MTKFFRIHLPHRYIYCLCRKTFIDHFIMSHKIFHLFALKFGKGKGKEPKTVVHSDVEALRYDLTCHMCNGKVWIWAITNDSKQFKAWAKCKPEPRSNIMYMHAVQNKSSCVAFTMAMQSKKLKPFEQKCHAEFR